ncbi:hypothetical protein G7046_g2547 [Stylonectria norvegica]|nr:hypothetical protein G7046_g2547 [Stylonectria norvegica]
MAEPAQPELSAAMPAMSLPDIKQEPSILDGLDFSMSPEVAMKRPFEDVPAGDEQSKRVKTETDNAHVNGFDNDHGAEESLEDGLALLVQNALNDVGNMVSQFTQNHDIPETTTDAMDVDSVPVLDAPLPPPPVTFLSDPQRYLRNASRYALGNLAISMLLILSQPLEDMIKSLRDTDSQYSQSFRNLQTSFAHIQQIYSTATTPILSPDNLELEDEDSRTILELSNLAQFGTWLVDAGLKPYSRAQEHFHSVFPGQTSDLSPVVVELFLALKTQIAIESLAARSPEQQVEQVLNEIMTDGLEEKLLELHGGFELTTSDYNLASSVRLRKEALQGEAQTQAEAVSLRERYPEDELLRNFRTHTKGRLASITELGTKLGLSMPPCDESPVDFLPDAGDGGLDLDDLSSFFEKTTSGLVQNALAGLTEDEPPPPQVIEEIEQPVEEPKSPPKTDSAIPQTNGKVDLMTDYKELEALVAESTSNYVKTTLHGLSPVPYQPTVPTTENMAAQSYLSHLQQQTQAQHPYYSYTQQIPEPQPPPPGPGENLPPNQTFPSAILYDKARQAALSKSSAHTRREGLHSTRRPWTQEEEKALMAGLDMVKGPHWSQILTLFGPNGTISDILKDRTQVQLKDKARNLKLFFLKTNSEMPYYLQAVTGELKTRAPTQAARKEAEERARMNSEEEQARIQGIMTLAGGLQNPPQGRTTGSPATAVGSGVITPAQAASAAQAASTQVCQTSHHAISAHSMASHSGYPASSLPQSRPSMPATTQQALHSVPQPPPRPQTQQSLQSPRPQSQHQTLPHSHPQLQLPSGQSPAQSQAGTQSRSQTATPVGQLNHSPAQQHTPAPQHTPNGVTQPAQQPIQSQYHLPHPPHTFPSPQITTQSSSTPQVSHTPLSHAQPDVHNDNAAEAALLQGLQAAVAESI